MENKTIKSSQKIIIFIVIIISLLYIFIKIQSNNNQHFINDSPQIRYTYNTIKNIEVFSTNYRQEILNLNPKIIYIHNFISHDEAVHFIELAEKIKRPSTIDAIGNPRALNKNTRSSNSAHIGKSRDDIVINVEKKASLFTNEDVSRIEPLQVVIYEKGQKYNPHYDFFSSESSELTSAGNRTKTILVYLNDLPDEAGGNTFFPKLNLRVKPKACDAIYFENMNDGKLNYDTLHAGEEIMNDTKKYAINIWFRENKF